MLSSLLTLLFSLFLSIPTLYSTEVNLNSEPNSNFSSIPTSNSISTTEPTTTQQTTQLPTTTAEPTTLSSTSIVESSTVTTVTSTIYSNTIVIFDADYNATTENETSPPPPSSTFTIPTTSTLFPRHTTVSNNGTELSLVIEEVKRSNLKQKQSKYASWELVLPAIPIFILLFYLVIFIFLCIKGRKQLAEKERLREEQRKVRPTEVQYPEFNEKEFRNRGPLKMKRKLTGPLRHKLDDVKSHPIDGIRFDTKINEERIIGTEIEQLTTESKATTQEETDSKPSLLRRFSTARLHLSKTSKEALKSSIAKQSPKSSET